MGVGMSWYLACWKKYADFSGRARRKEYWFFALFNLIVLYGLMAVAMVAGSTESPSLAPMALMGLYGLASFLPSLAVAIRRLHDTGRSGWWLFIALVPILGGLALFVFTVLDSQPGENAYGPNPKGPSVEAAATAF
jgi:uncharacterized membrane protein YhaH (DUF805 family)